MTATQVDNDDMLMWLDSAAHDSSLRVLRDLGFAQADEQGTGRQRPLGHVHEMDDIMGMRVRPRPIKLYCLPKWEIDGMYKCKEVSLTSLSSQIHGGR